MLTRKPKIILIISGEKGTTWKKKTQKLKEVNGKLPVTYSSSM